MNKDRLWLCVDNVIKKLTSANHWVTSIDSFKTRLRISNRKFKKVKSQIEEENDSKN